MNMHRSLPFAALVLAPLAVTLAGCHHRARRAAYEIHYEPGAVAYRAPTPRAYAHGHSRHHCDSRCDRFWPDVYEHGAAGHHCDDACREFRPARAERTVVVAPRTYHEVRVYPHGHGSHACEPRCGSYRGNLTVSGGVVDFTTTVYHHGHARHRCSTSCGSYSWPHGHARHSCHGSCHGWRQHAAPVQVVIHPHGHRLHACGQGCGSRSSSWRAAVEVDTPREHRCGSGCGCGDYRAPRRRAPIIVIPHHPRAPRVFAPHHHAPRVVAPRHHHRGPRLFAPHHAPHRHAGAIRFGLHFGRHRW